MIRVIGDFMQRRFTERRVNDNVIKSTVSMALANRETPFDVGVDAAFSETSLRKVSKIFADKAHGVVNSLIQGLFEVTQTPDTGPKKQSVAC